MASPPHRLSKHFPFLVVELALSPFLPAPEVKIVPGGGGQQARSLLTIFLGEGQD